MSEHIHTQPHHPDNADEFHVGVGKSVDHSSGEQHQKIKALFPHALDKPDPLQAISDMAESGAARIEQTVIVKGIPFTVRYERRGSWEPYESVDITITTSVDTKFYIPITYSLENKKAFISEIAFTGSLSGQKLYSTFLRSILTEIDSIESAMTNEEIHDISARKSPYANEIPDCILKAYSPVTASRGKDFINILDGTGSHLQSIRVNEDLGDILEETKKWEKQDSPLTAQDLLSIYKAYLQEEHELSKEVRDALESQMDYLKGHCT